MKTRSNILPLAELNAGIDMLALGIIPEPNMFIAGLPMGDVTPPNGAFKLKPMLVGWFEP